MEKSLYEEEGEAASYLGDKNIFYWSRSKEQLSQLFLIESSQAHKNIFYTSFKPTGI